MHKETIFTCSPPRYQLERTVQKDRVNQTQSVGQGTRQRGASLLKNSSPSEGVETRQTISGFIILSTASASDNASSTISFS